LLRLMVEQSIIRPGYDPDRQPGSDRDGEREGDGKSKPKVE
jgi:hypothetical protein